MSGERTMNFEAFQDNVALLYRLRDQIAAQVKEAVHSRILDYGAGAVAQTAYLLSSVRKQGVTVVAYDPQLDASRAVTRPEGGIELTAVEPEPQTFDVVYCGFLLHHLGPPVQEIGDLSARYGPHSVALTEYDYKDADAKEFEETFVSMAELEELRRQFGGDVEQCYRFHARLGETDYKEALTVNGFRVVGNERGRGFARHKFFLIGERE